LKDVEHFLLPTALHFFCEFDDFLLEEEDAVDVAAQFLHLDRVHVDDFCADEFYFGVGATGDLIDEVTNGQLGTLTEDILYVFALHKLHVLDDLQQRTLIFSRLKSLAVVLACLSE